MRARLDHNIAHLKVEIQIFAQEVLGLDGPANNIVGFGRGRFTLGEFHILRPHRNDDVSVLCHSGAGMRLDLAQSR